MCLRTSSRWTRTDGAPLDATDVTCTPMQQRQQMDSPRTKQLHLRVCGDELRLVHATAARSGRSASELVRDLVVAEAARLERLETRAKR